MSVNSYATATPITPSDTAVFPATAAIYVGNATGQFNLTVVMAGSQRTPVTFVDIPNGIYPLSIIAVKATGTTTTSILALR